MWIVLNLFAFGNTQEMTEVNKNKLLTTELLLYR